MIKLKEFINKITCGYIFRDLGSMEFCRTITINNISYFPTSTVQFDPNKSVHFSPKPIIEDVTNSSSPLNKVHMKK